MNARKMTALNKSDFCSLQTTTTTINSVSLDRNFLFTCQLLLRRYRIIRNQQDKLDNYISLIVDDVKSECSSIDLSLQLECQRDMQAIDIFTSTRHDISGYSEDKQRTRLTSRRTP